MPGTEPEADWRVSEGSERTDQGGERMITGIMLSILIVFLPALIVFCVIKAIKHTLIIKQTKKRNEIPTALIASLWETNGPERRWGVK